MSTITFPYHGTYTAKRSGYEWHYWIEKDGQITCIERYYYDHYNGKDHLKVKKGAETKELFADIKKKLGLNTDGWGWVSADNDRLNEESLERIPHDGSYRKMKKTDFVTRINHRKQRIVYQHTPTKVLYYNDGGIWCATYPQYCYNTKTGEQGKWY